MKKRLIKILISALLFAIAIIVPFNNVWINKAIYILSYIIVGFPIVKEAIENIFRGKVFDENFLMTVATLGAFGMGEFPEAVAVMLLYQIGELFQSYAVDKSRKSIVKLMDIRPDYANVIRNNDIETVKPDEVKIGDIIIVKPGEKIPLDGVIIDGNTMLDTIALTGETVPKNAKEGDEILSGCINNNGVVKVKVTKEYGESTVSKILNLVENASNKKSKSENFITKFAKYYTPIVVIMALILAVVPPLILQNESFSDWLYRALAFLVVSCPCALVISIPLSFFGGLGGASKLGILIKGSNYLEGLSKTEIIVFDKTGTLTQGVFEVQKIKSIGISEQELLKTAAYAEIYSNHPIAQSIKKAYNKQIDETLITNTQEISGLGITADVEGKNIIIGNEKLMQDKQIQYEKCNLVGTIVYVAIENKYAGHILIADKIKEDSSKTIKELKQNKINKIVMLTGDRKNVGEDVARKIGINEVFTELLPDEKVKKVEEIIKQKSEKGKLIFVGDGINDAPVLALSDIGIAMGALGSDAAIEAADVVIMTDELSKIFKAIKLSKKTMKIVKQNIVFAILIKIFVLLLSAIGISTMWEAIFADVGVTVIVVLNSLRMLNINKI